MIEKKLTQAEIIDMELYEFFDLIAKANASEILTIKQTLISGKNEMLEFANSYKKKMFDFSEETFDPKVFDENLTRMVHCFALALYIDKKVTLCQRREIDLTPECFKNSVDILNWL